MRIDIYVDVFPFREDDTCHVPRIIEKLQKCLSTMRIKAKLRCTPEKVTKIVLKKGQKFSLKPFYFNFLKQLL